MMPICKRVWTQSTLSRRYNMERFVFTLVPKTAFATPLAGDTLFGQCCWALRHCFGAEKLTALLTGYTENKPFMVIADAMPQGFFTASNVAK